jgi:hypothetical protein
MNPISILESVPLAIGLFAGNLAAAVPEVSTDRVVASYDRLTGR